MKKNFLSTTQKLQKFVIYLCCFTAGQVLAEELIQPKQYNSNNQQYSFTVSPLSTDGLKGADYSMFKGGKQVWSKQLAFTAVMADVSSSGEVITCAYTAGLDPPYNHKKPGNYGYIQVDLYDVNGRMMWSQSIKRKSSMAIHQPPSPYCEQVLLQENSQQAFIWTYQNQQTQLQVINTITGTSINYIKIATNKADEMSAIKDMKYYSIDGSNLLLAAVTGRVYEDNEDGDGSYGYESDALYYLFDIQGQIVWQKQLMGSVDIRKTTVPETEQLQKAYSKQDAYFAKNDLIQFNRPARQFAITDYNDQLLHWYQISDNETVKPMGTKPLVMTVSSFQVEVKNQSSPKLLQSIDLTTYVDAGKKRCIQNYDAIDVMSDGALVLYEESSYTLTHFADLQKPPAFFNVPEGMFKDDYISQELMFVDHYDQININLGETSYAKYSSDGQLIGVQTLQAGCGEYCALNFAAQKHTARWWLENGRDGVMLVEPTVEGFEQKAIALNDSNGRWFEYIYTIQNDDQGRLLMLGRIKDVINQLYVLDANGESMVTLDLDSGYTEGATLAGEYVFISEFGNDEIAVLNLSGEVVRRFNTSNNQPPYLLKASHNKLYAVTPDAVLIYDISAIINPN